ncbi:TPA: delta-lysin family phenol-soluble modulin [Staphylococcus pseudintermedius]|uniref:Delta-hemolysin n=2 Tax=Staphylococcus intermedius group TaxID=2815305 RepID=A0AAQ0D8N3_9STAP|nr:hypothetical protein [Staphylococcus pseudintermedius]MTV22093.1 hypothetical protein [Staphylococcus delphini]QHW37451.1 hypothetical protein GZH82_08905 [Staphylococcus sp. MI 10-1553]EGQ0327212.1 hypothetical protein [Staphylococcus pseudintermedius]EGQ0358373.1 hypothetical protein [Staphylococcus pseudintermedius]
MLTMAADIISTIVEFVKLIAETVAKFIKK